MMMKRRSFLANLTAVAGTLTGCSSLYQEAEGEKINSTVNPLNKVLANQNGESLYLPDDPAMFSDVYTIKMTVLPGKRVPQIIAKNDKINNIKTGLSVTSTREFTAQYLGKDYGWFIS